VEERGERRVRGGGGRRVDEREGGEGYQVLGT